MALPPWWSGDLPDLVSRRDSMPAVERWQTSYVRYKTQPEAYVSAPGWELATSRKFAEKLAQEESAFTEDTLLYNGLAPCKVSLRIVDAPAEYAVPVKQDRRLTPNFKVRVDVQFQDRCSFPLTLKAYIISQQEKDSVPEWVPEDFLDPDAPPRKPITELKGNVCVTHNFDGAAEDHPLPPELAAANGGPSAGPSAAPANAPSTAAIAAQLTSAYGLPPDAAAAAALKFAGADPAIYNSLWSNDLDQAVLEQLLQQTQRGAAGAPAPNGLLTHDFEFCGVELLKPTRMNKAYLVFACSILEQDLMFVVYNIPTVGICRAEQRVKACQKLGINYADLAHVEHMYVPPAVAQTAGVMAPTGRGAAAAAAGDDDSGDEGASGGGGKARKRTSSQQAAAGGDALIGAEGLAHAGQHARGGGGGAQQQQAGSGGKGAAAGGAGGGAGGQQAMFDAMLAGMPGMQGLGGMAGLQGMQGLQGLQNLQAMQAMQQAAMQQAALQQAALQGMGGFGGGLGGGFGGFGGGGGVGDGDRMGSLNVEAMLAEMDGMINAVAANGMPQPPGARPAALPHSRMALREMLLEAYDSSGLSRKLTGQDIAALESQAGFPADRSNTAVSITDAQWSEFEQQYHSTLKLLQQISSVWNLEDPCVIAGFDMDRQGTVTALRNEPAGTFICRFSMSQPGCLVLTCKAPGHPNADNDGLVHAIIRIEDLFERRVDTWIRDFPGATHVLDVYKGKRVDKRKVFASNYTRLRALDALDDLDGLLGGAAADVVMGNPPAF